MATSRDRLRAQYGPNQLDDLGTLRAPAAESSLTSKQVPRWSLFQQGRHACLTPGWRAERTCASTKVLQP
jgi:hypothetical protein